ncbi:MAG: RHS repeat-associated core domain-containing protein, partial [Candidatus Binatia bacterium]
RQIHGSASRFAYTGHIDDAGTELLYFGARHYDPVTGSFLTPDPAVQYASPYAYSDGNPVLGRDADGGVFELTALEIVMIAVGTATFVDSLVSTGDLGHSLTAGIFAGFSVYFSSQLSTAVARPLARGSYAWLKVTASVASSGFQAIDAVEAIEDGRYAGGIVAAGMLAASLIGIESANDPGSGSTPAEAQARHGIEDRGMMDDRQRLDVNGICSTRPGCSTNTLLAARENLRLLFGGTAACVGGCGHVADAVNGHLDAGRNVLLRCNSFGAIKCLGALQTRGLEAKLSETDAKGFPRLVVEMSGAPLLRPPRFSNVTYQVNLFDPVVYVGTAYSTPLRSDVVLGRNWWVPAPVLVHHTRMYEKPFHEALAEIVP